MRSILRSTSILVVLLCIAGGLVWGFLASRPQKDADADDQAPLAAASRVTSNAGQTELTFDSASQKANGIAVLTVSGEKRAIETEAAATILQLQPLLDLEANYSAASMETTKGRATLAASETEYKRLTQLNQSGSNVSEKSLEAARSTFENDSATLRNAEQALLVLKNSIRLRWGPVVASWIEPGSPQLEALMRQQQFLLQVTATGSTIGNFPSQIVIELTDGRHLSAHLIAPLPQLDPRLQAPSSLYWVAAHPGMIPGMYLRALVPSGPPKNGVVIPSGSVVWWQGGAWCYVEKTEGKFAREELSTANPVPGGWFVTEGILPGTRLVSAGAQTLLSTEQRSQIQEDQD